MPEEMKTRVHEPLGPEWWQDINDERFYEQESQQVGVWPLVDKIVSEAQRMERREIADAVRGVIVGAGPLANEEFSKGLFDGWQMTKEAVLRLIDERGKRS
jgi:hypothetical protein